MDEGRREELLGAALGDPGGLGADERAALDALLAADPSAREELASGRALVRALRRSAPTGPGPVAGLEPPASLRERVLGATTGPPTVARRSSPVVPLPPPRRRARVLVLAAGAAVLLGAGLVSGLGLARLADAPARGPAGTLGAVEPVTFASVPEGVEVTASVVAHTWGTETVLEGVTGLTPGRTYRVVLVTDDGGEVEAGSFEAVTGAVDCRTTGAPMRSDVAGLAVVGPDGREVLSSRLPPVPAGA